MPQVRFVVSSVKDSAMLPRSKRGSCLFLLIHIPPVNRCETFKRHPTTYITHRQATEIIHGRIRHSLASKFKRFGQVTSTPTVERRSPTTEADEGIVDLSPQRYVIALGQKSHAFPRIRINPNDFAQTDLCLDAKFLEPPIRVFQYLSVP